MLPSLPHSNAFRRAVLEMASASLRLKWARQVRNDCSQKRSEPLSPKLALPTQFSFRPSGQMEAGSKDRECLRKSDHSLKTHSWASTAFPKEQTREESQEVAALGRSERRAMRPVAGQR